MNSDGLVLMSTTWRRFETWRQQCFKKFLKLKKKNEISVPKRKIMKIPPPLSGGGGRQKKENTQGYFDVLIAEDASSNQRK